MDNPKPMSKGSYKRKDCYRFSDRERSHNAGNPTPEVRIHGIGISCDEFFEQRGLRKPSISKILQSRGVVIGAKVWIKRKS